MGGTDCGAGGAGLIRENAADGGSGCCIGRIQVGPAATTGSR